MSRPPGLRLGITVQFSMAGAPGRNVSFATEILVIGSQLFKQWVFCQQKNALTS
jgi:hypothetical protein